VHRNETTRRYLELGAATSCCSASGLSDHMGVASKSVSSLLHVKRFISRLHALKIPNLHQIHSSRVRTLGVHTFARDKGASLRAVVTYLAVGA